MAAAAPPAEPKPYQPGSAVDFERLSRTSEISVPGIPNKRSLPGSPRRELSCRPFWGAAEPKLVAHEVPGVMAFRK